MRYLDQVLLYFSAHLPGVVAGSRRTHMQPLTFDLDWLQQRETSGDYKSSNYSWACLMLLLGWLGDVWRDFEASCHLYLVDLWKISMANEVTSAVGTSHVCVFVSLDSMEARIFVLVA